MSKKIGKKNSLRIKSGGGRSFMERLRAKKNRGQIQHLGSEGASGASSAWGNHSDAKTTQVAEGVLHNGVLKDKVGGGVGKNI